MGNVWATSGQLVGNVWGARGQRVDTVLAARGQRVGTIRVTCGQRVDTSSFLLAGAQRVYSRPPRGRAPAPLGVVRLPGNDVMTAPIHYSYELCWPIRMHGLGLRKAI